MNKKFIMVIIIAVVIIAVIAATFIYISSLISKIPTVTPIHLKYIKPSESLYLVGQNLLFSNDGKYIIPFTLFDYKGSNVSSIFVNESLLEEPPPSYKTIYIMNTTDECINCGNMATEISDIEKDLINYNVIKNSSQISIVSISNITNISNNSILIIPNGLLPYNIMNTYNLSEENPALALKYNESNTSILSYILMKGTNIIYIGKSFSNLVGLNGIILPDKNMPSYLSTSPRGPVKGEFYFTNSTFSFNNGIPYGPVTYEKVYNGAIIAFSNYLSAWPSQNDSAADISKSILQLYWVPNYISGTFKTNIGIQKNASGSLGVLLNSSKITYNYSLISKLNNYTVRVIYYTNKTYNLTNNSIYKYMTFKPDYKISGTLGTPSKIIPGTSNPIAITIFTNSSKLINIIPHLTIYYMNMTRYKDIYLTPFEASGNFSLIQNTKFNLPPGQYIAILKNNYEFEYASALFSISNITVNLYSVELSNNTYKFSVKSNGVPLSGMNYSVNVNGKYKQNGTIKNGSVLYILPKSAPKLTKSSTFNLYVYNHDYTNVVVPPTLHISSQYIEAIIVFLFAFILVVFVKPVNKDEFYVDISNLPKSKKPEITIKESELLSVFNKLNTYYHWNYMPLSELEFRNAISNYIRYNNIAVNLTLSNVEMILNEMVKHGDVINIDDMYAPKSWVALSNHDIKYLAIFKKLRIFMVTHAITFTDLDKNESADMVIATKDSRDYIIIYSETSKFKSLPVSLDTKTYIVFLNDTELYNFKEKMYNSASANMDLFRIYLYSGLIKLISTEHLDDMLL